MLFVIGLDLDLIHLLKRDFSGQQIFYLDKLNRQVGASATYYGNDEELFTLSSKQNIKFIFGTDRVQVKKNIDSIYKLNYLNAISSKSIIDENIQFGKGLIVQDKVYISSNCSIGDLVKLNVGCQLHHNVSVGNLVTVAPGVTLLGGAKVEDECFIGAGAILLPGVHLGRKCIVGAGSVVTKNFPEGTKIKGVPAVPFGIQE